MLVRSIRAQNFMRFERLCIEGLPTHGLIGIEGPNESGKSTIGELLLFAFFGRGRSREDAAVTRLIRWNAESLRVEIDFTLGEDDSSAESDRNVSAFTIYREIDRAGTNYVKIIRHPERTEVAAGNVEVQQFFAREARFDHDEFIQSFYYDQREDRSPQRSYGEFFHKATGITQLREVARQIRQEIHLEEEEFTRIRSELGQQRSQSERYGMNADKLPDLNARSRALDDDVGRQDQALTDARKENDRLRAEAKRIGERGDKVIALGNGTVSELLSGVETMLEDEKTAARKHSRLHGHSKWSRAFARPWELLGSAQKFATDVVVLTTAVRERSIEVEKRLGDDSLGLATQYQTGSVDQLAIGGALRRHRWLACGSLLVTLVAVGVGAAAWEGLLELDQQMMRTALFASGCVALVAFFLLAWSLALTSATKGRLEEKDGQVAALRQELEDLNETREKLNALLKFEAVDDIGKLAVAAQQAGDATVAERAKQFTGCYKALIEGADGRANKGVIALLAEVQKRGRDLKRRLLDSAKKSQAQLAEEETQLKKLQSDQTRIAGEIRECESQRKKKETIVATLAETEAESEAIRSGIDLRMQAIRLIDEAVAAIRTKMAPAIQAHLKSVLPCLTSDRYRDVKVNDDLEVSLFCSAKGDFLNLSELSGGTGEAIALALRMALSQAFEVSRVKRQQFVFLDEPFKMMDSGRIVDTLKALHGLSPYLRQVFVTQPNFTEKQRSSFCFHIATGTDVVELQLNGAT